MGTGEQDERNATIDTTVVEEAFSAGGKNINEAISQLPAEQQKALSQMYLFLVQVASSLHAPGTHPCYTTLVPVSSLEDAFHAMQNPSYGHNIRLQNWRDVQRAIAEEYQVWHSLTWNSTVQKHVYSIHSKSCITIGLGLLTLCSPCKCQ